MPKRRKRRKINTVIISGENTDMIVLWSLRILVLLGGHRKIISRIGFTDDDILAIIGLGEIADDEINPRVALRLLKTRLREMEARKPKPIEEPLEGNLKWLGKSIGLNRVEIEVLRFIVILNTTGALNEIVETLGELSTQQITRVLPIILNIPHPKIVDALSDKSTLLSSGLLRLDNSNSFRDGMKLELLENLQNMITQSHADPTAILEAFFYESQAPRLRKKDYQHIQKDYRLLVTYLRSALKARTRGVNILIYGESGTGKTELVRTLSADLKINLHEVAMKQEDGEPMQRNDRISSFMLSQKLLSRKKRCAILFDEIEDVFPDRLCSFFGRSQESGKTKAWFNRLLEESPVPAFWLSNEIRQIDPAFLRRFDYILEMRPPTRAIRRRILEKYMGAIPLSESWMTRMSNNEYLAPAHIEQAAKIAHHIDSSDSTHVEAILERVMGNTLEAMGMPRKSCNYVQQVTPYHLNYLNPDHDLEALVAGLKRSPHARLCLYGAPGTGKTAYGRYVAEQLDKPLVIKRGSDILSMWVGGSEKNIADMFREAESEDGVLLLDEADSFLQDRGGAQHAWEITQVNELLTQMEQFDGLFIASTNLVNTLDAASLRRFDMKISFDFMKPAQSWAMFQEVLQQGGFEFSDTQQKELIHLRLSKLDNLTPGDFATGNRQVTILGNKMDALYLVQALEKECRAKPGANKLSIGFAASI